MPGMALLGWSHVGICCADLERSTTFYEQVFGFTQLFTMELSVPATMEVEGSFLSRMLRRDDMRLELLQWLSVAPQGDGKRRSMLGLGLTHLAFRVDSYDDLLPAVEAHGGTVHGSTLTALDGGVQLLYVTDPDGVRLELMAGTPDFS
jgi:catechol 2,3-dioxygenase-like lactoylglutathione lyase family enzyme